MSRRVNLTAVVRDRLLQELVQPAAVGTKLPNEQVLAERFGVSRATVREAVGSLVDAGYLVRRHGSGTYVTPMPPRRHSLDLTLSYTQMIREAGMVPGLKMLGTEVRGCRPAEASALNLAVGEPVRTLERIRTADDRPIVYSQDVVPAALVAALDDGAFEESLFEVMAQAGYRVLTASAVLLPVNASAPVARILGVTRGTALQQITEVDYADGAVPVVASWEWHVPGVFELRVNRRSAV